MLDIEIQHVSFSYDTKLILSDICMDVQAGSFVCLLGPSGCGKSTLLRLIAGLETPNDGKIVADGQTVRGAGLQRGVVFQDYGLFPWMSAGENICIALKQRFPKTSKEERKELALQRISDVGLEAAVFDKLPKELSGGMKQRVSIARAFGIDPPVLLMDEPFAALDAVTRSKLQDLVLQLWSKEENRKTVFFVTHDVDEALFLATEIYVMGQSPSQVLYHYSFGDMSRPTKEQMWENPEIMELRNRLIRIINEEISLKNQQEA